LDLIRDRFHELSNAEVAPKGKSEEGMQAQNLAKAQEKPSHKAKRAKIDHELAKNQRISALKSPNTIRRTRSRARESKSWKIDYGVS